MYDQQEQDRLRKLWKKYWTDRFRLEDEGIYPDPLPKELEGYTCGARTRGGWPCKQRVLYINGRCKFHGGLSSGPLTPEGKKKCAENGKVRARTQDAETDPMKT